MRDDIPGGARNVWMKTIKLCSYANNLINCSSKFAQLILDNKLNVGGSKVCVKFLKGCRPSKKVGNPCCRATVKKLVLVSAA